MTRLDSFLQDNPWQKKSNPIWPVTSFNLRRNMARFNFPSRLAKDEMERLTPLLVASLQRVLGKEQAQFFPANEMSVVDKEFLFEHFLCEESFQNAGSAQGVVLTREGHFLAQINIGDHLNLHWVDCKEAWEDTWNQLAKLEKDIGSELAYAFSPKFGFLTSHLEACGTGLSVSAYLHVPALNHAGQLPSLLHNLEEIRATGMEGTSEHLLGDFLILKNAYTLGVSEEGILRSVHLAATKLAGAERSARSRLITENNTEMKDQITRSYGLLAHSYQLNTRETLTALSMIKLGIDLGWVEGITDAEVNALFLQVRRAHLLRLLGLPEEDPQAMQHQRASFIHKKLKEVHLKEVLQ